MKPHLAIMGGSGFIGKNFIIEYASKYSITIFGRRPSNRITILGNEIEYIQTDYSLDNLLKVLVGYDIVLNASSQKVKPNTSLEDYLGNVIITDNLIKACTQLGIRKYIQLSSRMVYDETQEIPWDEESVELPKTNYGLSKLLGDKLLLRSNKDNHTKYVSLRLSQVYGLVDGQIPEGQEGFIIFKFIHLAQNKDCLTLFGKGKGARDYVYIKDVVKGIDLAINSDAQGIINIGSGHATSFIDLSTTINELFENKGNLIQMDREEDTSITLLDITKAKRELNYTPEWNFYEGIEDIKANLRGTNGFKRNK